MNRSKAALSIQLLVLGLALALGVTAGVLFTIDATPTEFTKESGPAHVAVTQREIDDAVSVDLVPTVGEKVAIRTAASGLVTRFDCAPGARWDSGQALIDIDGTARYGLATSTPLWRDLTTDDRGPDVVDLQTELNRLGYPVATDGIVGPRTLGSVADLLQLESAARRDFTTIPKDRFIWLSSTAVSLVRCSTVPGATIENGADLAELATQVTRLAPKTTPAWSIEGPRVYILDDLRLPADDTGAVTDTEALAQAQAGPALAAWLAAEESNRPPLTASYALAQPVSAYAVPPGAIYNLAGTAGCVLDARGTAHPVTVVSSQLGLTLVTFDGMPDEATASPGDHPASGDAAPSAPEGTAQSAHSGALPIPDTVNAAPSGGPTCR